MAGQILRRHQSRDKRFFSRELMTPGSKCVTFRTSWKVAHVAFLSILTFSGAEEPRIVFHGVSHESPEHCSGVGGYCFDR